MSGLLNKYFNVNGIYVRMFSQVLKGAIKYDNAK